MRTSADNKGDAVGLLAWMVWLIRKGSKYAIGGGVFVMLISFEDDARPFGIGQATALLGIVGWLVCWIIGQRFGPVNR